MAFGFS
jgi:ATP-binding cassette subfamily B (MDR/TAP) protein 1